MNDKKGEKMKKELKNRGLHTYYLYIKRNKTNFAIAILQ